MADDVDPRAGELTTANYGFTKPNVGDSDDAWGGMINADLDSIDSTVKSVSNVANAAYPASNPSGYQTAANVTASLAPYALTASVPAASSTTPAMDGTAAVGAGTTWARADHIHPTDTSRYATSNPSGYQTAAQVTAAVPVASSTTPVMDGVAAVGVGTTWARADHVHPLASQAIGDNRIINGDMRIDQRNNGASGTTPNAYTVDRWKYSASLAAKGTWGRTLSNTPGFPYCLGFTSSSAYTPLTSDFFVFQQPIEADAISDFIWGTANAQAVTLSFWAYSSLTGTFGGAIYNYAGTRSYPFTYSIPVASTWTRIAITIPGDTAGTWVMSGNGGGLQVAFDCGAGATYRAAAGAWASGLYFGATGAANVVATNGAAFYVTGVKLEVGSVATPYNRQSLTKSMVDCQRYYQRYAGPANAFMYPAFVNAISTSYPIPSMRATPTCTMIGTWTYGSGTSGGVFAGASPNAVLTYVAVAGAANQAWYANPLNGGWDASAEL